MSRAAARCRFAPPASVTVVAATVLVACGCGDGPKPAAPGGAGAGPAAPAADLAQPGPGAAATKPAGPLPVFVDVAKEAGITAANHSGKALQKDWIVSGMGGGTVAFDYDGDGDVDLLVVDGTMLTEQGVLEYSDDARTRLYRNEGHWRFTEVTEQAGVGVQSFGFGGAACDYDLDGDLDVYVTCWGRNWLFRNRGDGTFEEVAGKAGVLGADDDMSVGCAWGDVNGDGFPDLYVSNYLDQWKVIEEFRREGKPGRSADWRGFKVYVGPPGLPTQMDRLWLGNCDGTFREVTATNLLGQIPYFGFTVVMSDLDNDGDLDIYVANDTNANHLWVNDGKGVFTDRAVETGCAMDRDMKEQASMGVDVADVNRDGFLDIHVTNFSHDYNTLYLNQMGRSGRLSFRDSTHQLNVARPSYLRLCWGTRLWDFDNDSALDVFVACGHVYGEIDHFEQTTGSTYKQRNLIMRNQGPPLYRYEDVTDAAGPAFAIKRVWRGTAFGDFDDDGDQDVFVTALNDIPAFYRNDGGNRNSWVGFRLVARNGSPDPPGARVTVRHPDGRPLLEELHHGISFCGDNDPRLFFGLGVHETAPRVEVRWPGGETQVFENVKARRYYVLRQGSPELREGSRPDLAK